MEGTEPFREPPDHAGRDVCCQHGSSPLGGRPEEAWHWVARLLEVNPAMTVAPYLPFATPVGPSQVGAV